MKFIAEINVMPLKALLDPKGKAVGQVMQQNGFKGISNIRIGKHLSIEVEAESESAANKLVENACHKVLINPIVEHFEFSLHKV
jgi:phosphoribosylformylglycinamidine synthase PurS subunit